MQAFQTICVALAVATSQAQYVSYGNLHGSPISYAAPTAVRTSYVAAAPAYATVAAAPAYTVAASPVAVQAAPVQQFSVQAAPVQQISVQAAPVQQIAVQAAPVQQIAVQAAPAQAVNLGVVATAPAGGVRTHEVHTGSGRQAIRIEDYQAGDQVIRVHEAPQAGPQIAQVRVPGEQHHIRVVNHQSGRAHVERTVQRQQTQVFNVQRPGRPGARIVQVVRDQSPAPSVEFLNAGGSNHHVYHANDAGAGLAAPYAGAVHAVQAAPVAVHAVQAAPVAVHAVQAAPVAVHAVQAAPVAVHAVQAVQAAPVTVRTIQAAPVAVHAVHAAPSTFTSYGGSYGY